MISNMAINGNDVMNILSLKPGPTVGKALKHCFEWVLDNPQQNNKEALSEYLKTIKF